MTDLWTNKLLIMYPNPCDTCHNNNSSDCMRALKIQEQQCNSSRKSLEEGGHAHALSKSMLYDTTTAVFIFK